MLGCGAERALCSCGPLEVLQRVLAEYVKIVTSCSGINHRKVRKPSRVRRYLETSQPSGVCRDASSNMPAFRKSPARVSGLAQASYPSVSTLRGLTCCPKEHTFWDNPAESQDSRRFLVYANAPRERRSPRKPL